MEFTREKRNYSEIVYLIVQYVCAIIRAKQRLRDLVLMIKRKGSVNAVHWMDMVI